MTCRPRCSGENSKCCAEHISFSWLAADGWKAWHAKVRFWSAGGDLSSPNTINANIFHPAEQVKVRLQCNLPIDKKLLLFGSLKATDPRKGIDYLMEACRILKEKHPDLATRIGIV